MEREIIKKLIQNEFVNDIVERDGRRFISTGLCYPSGDSLIVYLERGPHEIRLHDAGACVRQLKFSGVKMTKERLDHLRVLSQRIGSSFEGNVFNVKSTRADLAFDCMRFCELLLHASSMHFDVEPPRRSTLQQTIDRLLKEEVAPKRKITKQWTLPQFDPEGLFPVDYHVNGQGPSKNLFYVTTEEKAVLVTAVVNFLANHKKKASSMAVVDPESKIGNKAIDRMRIVLDEVQLGFKKTASRISEFLLT